VRFLCVVLRAAGRMEAGDAGTDPFVIFLTELKKVGNVQRASVCDVW